MISMNIKYMCIRLSLIEKTYAAFLARNGPYTRNLFSTYNQNYLFRLSLSLFNNKVSVSQ